MARYRGFFIGRADVVELDGGLFAGNVYVGVERAFEDGSFGLTEDTRFALHLFEHARLRKCSACRRRFIAHHAARLCSPECRAKGRKASQVKAIANRSKHRTSLRQNALRWCVECETQIVGSSRKTRRFCSGACRQAHRRKSAAAAK